MKTTKNNKKLTLKMVTVTNLNDQNLDAIRGGATVEPTGHSFCDTACTICNTEGLACRPTTRCNVAFLDETDYTLCI